MNPDFDYLLWDRALSDDLSLYAGLLGEHVTHDGRLCCQSEVPSYQVWIAAFNPRTKEGTWGGIWGTRKLSEIPL